MMIIVMMTRVIVIRIIIIVQIHGQWFWQAFVFPTQYSMSSAQELAPCQVNNIFGINSILQFGGLSIYRNTDVTNSCYKKIIFQFKLMFQSSILLYSIVL